jgi:hypothetical protein
VRFFGELREIERDREGLEQLGRSSTTRRSSGDFILLGEVYSVFSLRATVGMRRRLSTYFGHESLSSDWLWTRVNLYAALGRSVTSGLVLIGPDDVEHADAVADAREMQG